MILQRLKLNNFRCYAGSIDLHFATTPDKNVTIINGTNGAGKTSILQALYFVLYGRSAVTTDSPLIHQDVLKTGSEHAPAKASVILEFVDRGTHYRITRKIFGFYVGDRVHYIKQADSDELLLTYIAQNGNTEKESHPALRIESMLPAPIRTFFFFDGDRISDFTKPGRERDSDISRAVNDVLHIEALSRAVAHTSKIATDKKRSVIAAAPPTVAQTTSEIRTQELAVERKKTRLEGMKLEEQDLLEKVERLDTELTSILAIAQASRARTTLESNRSGLLEKSKQLRRQLARATVAAVPALAIDRINAATEILSRYKSRHEIPARIADHFLRDLLSSGECICGRSITGNVDARQHLQDLLDSLLPDSLQDVATELSNRLRPLLGVGVASIKNVVALLSEISSTGDEVSKIDREIQRLGGEIDMSSIENAQKLNRQRADLTRRVGALKEEKPLAARDVELAEKNLKLLEVRLRTETARRNDLRELNGVWALARECADALARGKAKLEERLRASLTLEATDIMKKLVSTVKSYAFTEIKVDDGFILRVLDNESRDVRPQLSAGETQVSSLAFMLAMTRLGGQEAPLVIDTPLARLDRSVRANFARWLPQLTTQLVLLVTDAEYEDAVRKELQPRVGANFNLVPSAGGTSIVEVTHA